MANTRHVGAVVRKWALFFSLMFLRHGAPASGQQGVGGAPAAYVPTMTFDVASVREADKVDSYTVTGNLDPHTSAIRLQNFDMSNLLNVAYGIDWYNMVGVPEWPYPAMFTIVAKSDTAADERLAKLSDREAVLEKQHMLQALLAERFKLKAHWETRQGPVYDLVVAKPGRLRLHEAKGAPPSAEETKAWGDHAVPALYQRNDGRGYDFVGRGASMSDIVVMLSGQLGHPVKDKTGLTARYDFVLKYYGRTKQDRQVDDMDPTLPIDEAIEAELGLKVVPAKGAIQVLVIDHVEKPSEN